MKEEFDSEAAYDREIAPLMTQIIGICRREGIPMIASFCYQSDHEGPHFCSTKIPIDGRNPGEYARAWREIARGGCYALAITVSSPEVPK